MKTTLLLLAMGLTATEPLCAQLVITSFNQNGQLTWTNVVANATYRVEWAGSPTGAWQGFEVLTNLSSISPTSGTVTVQVPTFYRVVWTDAPSPLGEWDYQGYDSGGLLVVTGKLNVLTINKYLSGWRVEGEWQFVYAGPATNSLYHLGPQLGTRRFRGAIPPTLDNMSIVEYWGGLEELFTMFGSLSDTEYQGEWDWSQAGGETHGSFIAVRSGGQTATASEGRRSQEGTTNDHAEIDKRRQPTATQPRYPRPPPLAP